jgi:hypothetical protein
MISIVKHPPEYEIRTRGYDDITLEELAEIGNDNTQEAYLDGDAQEATIIRKIK